jgi:hypothetical protein
LIASATAATTTLPLRGGLSLRRGLTLLRSTASAALPLLPKQ